MLANQEIATVGRAPLEATFGDILTWIPATQSVQVPSQLVTSKDFLSVQYKETEVVFLLYNADTFIFDPSIWPQTTRYGRSMILKDKLLAYVIENTGRIHFEQYLL